MRKTTFVTSSNLDLFSSSDILPALFHSAISERRAVALWQLPGEQNQQALIDLAPHATRLKPDLEALTPGFLFAPFNNPNQEQSLHLEAGIYFNSMSKVIYHDHSNRGTFDETRDRLLASIHQQLKQPKAVKYYCQELSDTSATSKEQFKTLVHQSVAAIKEGLFHKVVPARKMIHPLEEKFNPIDTFLKLCHSYPQAFVSLVSIPDVGTWLGATPETLVSVDKDQVFTTSALAGTQAVGTNTDTLAVAWRQKEIEEQAMVSRYIINCFKKIRLREFEEVGPMTIQAGNLMHLKTIFEVDMVAVNFPQLGSVMLELLHPTSAVCGLPQKTAQSFLKEYEGLDRAFFSGYLGPVNIQQGSNLFVNLRCTQLFDRHAVLYAGAGVTAHSEAEKEWRETELKCRTLLNVLEVEK